MRARNRQQVAISHSVTAPTGGLNARDALSMMPPEDAVIMDNWFPGTTAIALRGGTVNWKTGFPGWVETILAYNTRTGTNKLFGIASGNIYDATTQGAVGAAVVSGLSNSRWNYTNFGTPGGVFLYACNGADSPLLYDGSSWTAITGVSTPAITGVTTSTLTSVIAHQQRLWFIEKESMKIWYLPVASIGGAALSIDFSSLFKLGGYIMALASLSVDAGTGMDDHLAIITSEGEVALYQGYDPSSIGTWALVGVFKIGRPMGRRCVTQYVADAVIITTDGIYPLSQAIISNRLRPKDALSDKIRNLINTDAANYFSNFGWEATVHPIGKKLIINVPVVTNTSYYQYVMNTESKSWCRFVDLNTACWEVQGNVLYSGCANQICVQDTGTPDTMTFDLLTAFNFFKDRVNRKKFNLVRPVFQISGSITGLIGVATEYSQVVPETTFTLDNGSGSPWDTSPWDTSYWSDTSIIITDWIPTSSIGFCGALRCQGTTIGAQGFIQATDYVYERGGVL